MLGVEVLSVRSAFEMFPGPGTTRTPAQVQEDYELILKEFTTGRLKTEDDVGVPSLGLSIMSPGRRRRSGDTILKRLAAKSGAMYARSSSSKVGQLKLRKTEEAGRDIPRDIMLKVVRRDDHVCQKCFKYVPDNELEFDHTIPVSRGGPTSVENIKLYCRSCNREKSNKLTDILIDR